MNAPRGTAGAIPTPGQIVILGPDASPQFRYRSLRLLITEPAQASTVDLLAGRQVDRAEWLILTGWELSGGNRRVVLRTVSVRTSGITISSAPAPPIFRPRRGPATG